jgi:microcystin-dependent protein
MVKSDYAVVILTDAVGVETVQAIGLNYSITVNGDGGAVTFVTAPPAGYKVTIKKVVSITQDTKWEDGGKVSQKSFENAVDKLTDIAVQLQEQVDRAPTFAESSAFKNVIFPPLVANKALKVNAAGTGLEMSSNDFDTIVQDATAQAVIATAQAEIATTQATIATTQANIAIAARTQADADAAATAADRIAVAADKVTVAGDKATVASDKATVAADKAIVAADKATVAADTATATNASTTASNAAATATAQATIATTQAGIASTKANDAATSAANALVSETNAAASALIASNAATGQMYNAVIDVSANATLNNSHIGNLVRVDTSAGARTITLPSIALVGEGWRVAVAKKTGDSNPVNVAVTGADSINGTTSYQIGSQWSAATIVADAQTNSWFAIGTGAGAGAINVDRYTGNGSQTLFTLAADPGTLNATEVHIDGVYQNKNTYTVVGTSLTFSEAPPNGSVIEVKYGSVLSIGVPADGTVSTSKLVDGNVTSSKIVDGAVSTSKVADQGITTQKIADKAVTTAKLDATGSTSGQVLTSTGATTSPSWQTISGIPSGSITMFGGTTAPSGWLLCDGSAVSRTTYAALFTAISTAHGAGDGSTTFNLPDMRGRAPIGAGNGSGLSARTLGGKVGAETHSLSVSEMPAHTHDYTGLGGSGTTPFVQGIGPVFTTTTTSSAGGGAAHNNMQPSYVVNFIIKV